MGVKRSQLVKLRAKEAITGPRIKTRNPSRLGDKKTTAQSLSLYLSLLKRLI